MLNKVILSGRIANDLEVRQTQSGTPVLQFTLAVERSYARQGEQRQTDFISCVAWNKTAEFIARYFEKGRSIAVIGNLRTRTYDDKNGSKHYVTEVFIDEAQFTFEPKQNASDGAYSTQEQAGYNDYTAQGSAPQRSAQTAQNAPQDIPEGFDLFGDDGVPF